ncbi:MAG: hypothetical protein ACRCSQ_08600 [Bacteroidales bacterium]
MEKEKLSALFIPEENAIDFQVRTVLPVILSEVKFDDIEEMYVLDAASENYFLVGDLEQYASLEEIVQPSYENGNLSIFDFDIQLKNGVSIYTHDNLTIEAPDQASLFKYVDFIFRYFHLDAVAAKERLIASPNEEVTFDVTA